MLFVNDYYRDRCQGGSVGMAECVRSRLGFQLDCVWRENGCRTARRDFLVLQPLSAAHILKALGFAGGWLLGCARRQQRTLMPTRRSMNDHIPLRTAY